MRISRQNSGLSAAIAARRANTLLCTIRQRRSNPVVRRPNVRHACIRKAPRFVVALPHWLAEVLEPKPSRSPFNSAVLTGSLRRINAEKDANRTKNGEIMLAAAPKEHARHLYSFCLALRLVEQGRADIPRDVAVQFDDIVNQVRALLHTRELRMAIAPEAIALLLEIRGQHDLEKSIDELPKLNSIKRETARNLLTSMEQRLALQD